MSDEHEQPLHPPRPLTHLEQELLEMPNTNMATPWVDVMTPEQRERQLEKRPTKGGAIATWVILIGMAVLVLLACVLPALR